MLKFFDKVFDGFNMYKLLILYLSVILLGATVLSFFKVLAYNPLYLLLSTSLLVFFSWLFNYLMSYIFDAPVNPESSIITGLILALIITPTYQSFTSITFILAVTGLAMASKYILAIKERHLFNPAAVAVFLTSIGPKQSASWWVGSAALMPIVLIGGIILVRKIKREEMLIYYVVASLIVTTVYAVIDKSGVITSLKNAILTSPLLFLGFVMLTEPLTSPSNRKTQRWYAVIVGGLIPPQVHFLSYYTSPEVGLLIGNIFGYLFGPKTKLFLYINKKIKVAKNTLDFVFIPDKPLSYLPGQYMEWTLPHDRTDFRGSRRYFTLASSPTESNLRLGIKFYNDSSSYKKKLIDGDEGTLLIASHVSGDFVMPKNKSEKLVFIAGGIGITPFRSMVKYLIDKNEKRDITLLYFAGNSDDFAYKEIFEEARAKLKINVFYFMSQDDAKTFGNYSYKGVISGDLIKKMVPDYSQRKFYICGPTAMLTATNDILLGLSLTKKKIVKDYFPGYI